MTSEQAQYYEDLMEQLRHEVKTFRTALRLETPGDTFPVVAESLGETAETTKGPLPYDLTAVGTVQWLMKEKRILVQHDCYKGPQPPKELMEVEHVGAQLLGPLFRGDTLVGIVAAHHADEPRQWTGEDVAAMAHAMDRVYQQINAPTAVT